jgi:anti-sigma-K factor RskA
MATRWQFSAMRLIRRLASVAGIVALSVASTLAVQHLLAPAPAQAQTGQAQEISATAFNLVDANGTVRARLGANKTDGAGVNLSFFDPSGQNRLVSLGSGDTQIGPGLSVNAADGQTLRIFVGNSGAGSPIGAGFPTIAAFDGNGSTPRPRAALGQGTNGEYSLQFRDDTGQLTDSIP